MMEPEENAVSGAENNYLCWFINDDSNADEHVTEMQYSPCGVMVAVVSPHNLRVLRLIFNGHVPQKTDLSHYATSNVIEIVKWSSDSKALLAISSKSNSVEVLNPLTAERMLSIQEPMEFAIHCAFWLPDCQHIIVSSKHGIFSNVYCLGGEKHLLPSISTDSYDSLLVSFSPNGLYAAFVQFVTSGYHIVFISTVSWKILWRKNLDGPTVSGLVWSEDSLMFVVFFNAMDMRIHVFELNGHCCHVLQHSGENSFVIKTVKFSPCSKLLAVKCEDQQDVKVYIYNMLTYQLAAVLDHFTSSEDQLREPGIVIDCSMKSGMFCSSQDGMKLDLAFSNCGKFLAVPNFSGDVYVWNMMKDCSLTSILHTGGRISDLKWHPQKTYLAVVHSLCCVTIWKTPNKSFGAKKMRDQYLIRTIAKSPLSVQWSNNHLLLKYMGKSFPQIGAVLFKRKKRFKKEEQ